VFLTDLPHLLGVKEFTFCEPCIVIHMREKDQKDTHFFLINLFH